MHAFVPAIYDVTIAIPKDQPSPTMLRILKGQSSVVSIADSLLLSFFPLLAYIWIIHNLLEILYIVAFSLPILMWMYVTGVGVHANICLRLFERKQKDEI